jgi:hypothetical protein
LHNHVNEPYLSKFSAMTSMTKITPLELHSPSGETLKQTRLQAGLSQVEAATLMGYPLQVGSRGSLQSRTWQALESTTDARNMPAPVFALFQLLTGQHPELTLTPKEPPAPTCAQEEPESPGLPG